MELSVHNHTSLVSLRVDILGEKRGPPRGFAAKNRHNPPFCVTTLIIKSKSMDLNGLPVSINFYITSLVSNCTRFERT